MLQIRERLVELEERGALKAINIVLTKSQRTGVGLLRKQRREAYARACRQADKDNQPRPPPPRAQGAAPAEIFAGMVS